MLYYLVLGGAFLSAVLLTAGIHQFLFASRQAMQERLKVFTSDVSVAALPGEEGRDKNRNSEIMGLLGLLGGLLPQRSGVQNLQQKLNQAHLLIKAQEFLGFKLFLGALAVLAISFLSGNLAAGGVLGVLAYKLPDVYLNMRRGGRMQKLTEQLPEALGIIASGLRAGFSFPQALAVVGREMEAPIQEEFSRVLWENRMGKPMEEALRNMGERTDSDELDLFITAIIIQNQVGGNLAEILDNISNTVRERVRLKGEIKTLTTQGRLSAIIIILLPVGVGAGLSAINPGYMQPLFTSTLGLCLLGAAIFLMLIGISVIRKIVDIKF